MDSKAVPSASDRIQADVDSAIALAGLKQFLIQPRSVQKVELLLLAANRFWNARIEQLEAGPLVIVFELEDERGQPGQCRCNPAAFALLLTIRILGQSVFINTTSGRRYVKVFGRVDDNAGIIFARLLLGAENDEQVGYRNRNQLDLTFGNLILSSGSSKRGTVDWYSLALGQAAGLSDSLFAGSPEEKFSAANHLLKQAVENVTTELADLTAA